MPSKTRSFPSGSETASLLNTFGVFWLGALMRSVGAIVLGAYIDQIGLRQGLINTPSIMAIGTIIIAFSRYATIGIAAPVIALFGQLLQGFSAGVELAGFPSTSPRLPQREAAVSTLVSVLEPAGCDL
ncbi:MFS family permease [Bradyrhizobium sp. LA6.10]